MVTPNFGVTMKHQTVITQPYVVISLPNVSGMITNPSLEHICLSILNHGHSATYWQQEISSFALLRPLEVFQIHPKFAQLSCELCMMLYYEYFDHILNAVATACVKLCDLWLSKGVIL